MIIKSLLLLILVVWSGQALVLAKATSARPPVSGAVVRNSRAATHQSIFDLSSFGATGDGVTDDGPALQDALNAIATAGGGTLFVPAGRYAIITPVEKDFTGLASTVTILGVESLTPVAPPTAVGSQLSRGLNLLSEFAPRTGAQENAITITGLQSFLIKDIAFIGTPDIRNDALITISLNDIEDATVRHCEFYGVSSLVTGGAIVQAVRSNLKIDQSVFLGSTCSSGVYSSVVQNIEWKGITVTDAIFADYGRRPELWGKLSYAAPYSWVNLGRAAAVTSDSPRREAVIRSVFLDEGSFAGISSLPRRYGPSAPIDLVYITGLYMNVTNLGAWGHYLDGLERLLVENSRYGWSHNAHSAIFLVGTGNAILDCVVTEASATRITADATTKKLTLIDCIYETLASQAQTTKVITTETPEDDPVQYVRQQFVSVLQRDPDAAAHFYWSDRLLQCGEDAQCVVDERNALGTYLGTEPSANFSVTGKVIDENGASLSGVSVALRGSQTVTTLTDAQGQYHFSNLPTSGVYTITPSKIHYTFNAPVETFTTPNGDQTADFAAKLNRHSIDGHIIDGKGQALAGVTLTLSGRLSGDTKTDNNGNFTFANLPAGGNYTIVASKPHYTFTTASKTFNDLGANQIADFAGTLNLHSITGRATRPDGGALVGVKITLSGTQTATVITDTNGAFALTNLPGGGNYTLKPSKTSYSWAPPTLSFNDLSVNQTANFTGTFVTYTISGRALENQNGVGGVSVLLSGSQTATVTTNANGSYSFILPSEGNYTITPSKKHYTFNPASVNFNNLSANHTADLAATLIQHSISGRVTNTSNQGISGVSLTLSGAQAATTTTDANGNFLFAKLAAGGTYTVTPSLAHHSFHLKSETFADLGADQLIKFVGSRNTHTIIGRVTKDGVGFPGATITLSSAQSSVTVTSDGSGAYSFSRVLAGDNYTVTAMRTNCTFVPPSQTFNNLGSDRIANFSAFFTPVLLTVENSERALALESVTFATSPFSLVSTSPLGSTSRTRIIVFAMNIDLPPGGSPSAITAEAEASQNRIFPLTIEYVGTLSDVNGHMQIIFVLPDQPTEGGDLWISLKVRGIQSNKALITIRPS